MHDTLRDHFRTSVVSGFIPMATADLGNVPLSAPVQKEDTSPDAQSARLCKVSYRLWKIEGERLAGQTEETHRMRYFFPLELDLFLESSGFIPVRLGAFPEFDRDPDTTTWNALAVARAV